MKCNEPIHFQISHASSTVSLWACIAASCRTLMPDWLAEFLPLRPCSGVQNFWIQKKSWFLKLYTLPETNSKSTWNWMELVRILMSFWGPAYFQRLLLLVSGRVHPANQVTHWRVFDKVSSPLPVFLLQQLLIEGYISIHLFDQCWRERPIGSLFFLHRVRKRKN